MKRVVRAATESKAEKLHKLIVYMNSEGVDEHEMFLYFLDRLPTEQSIAILEDYAALSDLDLVEADLM